MINWKDEMNELLTAKAKTRSDIQLMINQSLDELTMAPYNHRTRVTPSETNETSWAIQIGDVKFGITQPEVLDQQRIFVEDNNGQVIESESKKPIKVAVEELLLKKVKENI